MTEHEFKFSYSVVGLSRIYWVWCFLMYFLNASQIHFLKLHPNFIAFKEKEST